MDRSHTNQPANQQTTASSRPLHRTKQTPTNPTPASGVYLSHETFTHASDASSCAANEIFALRSCFGDHGMEKLIVLNTKGYTGHPMGAWRALPCLLRRKEATHSDEWDPSRPALSPPPPCYLYQTY